MKTNLFICIMLLPVLGLANVNSDVFIEGGYLAAKKKAKIEGKIQLLEFVAQWCLPCKHMDQTTFKDEGVKELLRNHFVSVKIDIDQFDGFALKEEFQVRYLPTIIMLDTDGNVIHRIEEAVNASQLTSTLESLIENNPINSAQLDNELKVSTTSTVPSKTISKISVPALSPSITENDDLEHLDRSTNEVAQIYNTHYILQFGVFGSLKNAKNLYEKIKSELPSNPEIKTIDQEGRTLYKIQYGPFTDQEEADSLRLELLEEGIESLIKKLE